MAGADKARKDHIQKKKRKNDNDKERTTMRKIQLENTAWTMRQKMWRVKNALIDQKGEGYVDTAVKILIAVVLGALRSGS